MAAPFDVVVVVDARKNELGRRSAPKVPASPATGSHSGGNGSGRATARID